MNFPQPLRAKVGKERKNVGTGIHSEDSRAIFEQIPSSNSHYLKTTMMGYTFSA